MLTVNTQIPTVARGLVRAAVKAHPDWQAYIGAQGKVSAQALNRDLLDFALRYPTLTAQIEAILNGIAPDTQDTSCEVEPVDMPEPVEPVAPAIDGEFTLDSVMAEVSPFIGSKVQDILSTALRPIIAAANKPAVEIERTVEVERIVEVAPGEAPRISTPKARRDRKVTFRALYPSKAKDIWRDKQLTIWAGAATPDIDPFYVVDHFQMSALMLAMESGMNVWLTGPAATGKSTMPEQAAATLGRPCITIGMTRQTEIADLVGGHELINGNTCWKDGALIKAIRQPGMVIVIDEMTIAPAGIQAIFMQLCASHRSYTLPTGEVVKCADGVVFVVADNTAGAGDEGGLYAGTNISNVALVTRFQRMLHIDYLAPAKEAEALSNHTACPLPAARQVADWVANCRRNPVLAGVVISMRQLIGFVRSVQHGYSAKDSFVMSISSRMPATERATIEAMIDLAWCQGFEALMEGKPMPTGPSNSAAAQAFADEQF